MAAANMARFSFASGLTLGELGQSSRGGTLGFAVGDQEVTGVTVLNFNNITQVTQVNDFFEKNDLHRDYPLWLSVKGSRARKRARLMARPSWR